MLVHAGMGAGLPAVRQRDLLKLKKDPQMKEGKHFPAVLWLCPCSL